MFFSNTALNFINLLNKWWKRNYFGLVVEYYLLV
jgi:hypothetical protein